MPQVSNEPDNTATEQRKLLEALVGDIPALAPGTDTGAGIMVPEGHEATAFYDSFTPQAKPAANGSQPASTQTQAAEPAQAPQPAPAAQPPTQPSGRLLAGKYRSVEELERGYAEADKTLRERNQENMTLKAAQLAAQAVGGFRREREDLTPAPPPAAHIPVQFQGDQPVVPINDLRTELLNAARAAAQETVSGILRPMQQLGDANANLRSSYPEFAQQESAFTGWLRDNPRYQELIQQSPDVGLESAYLKYQHDTGSTRVAQATETTLAAQQQIQQARSQAAPAGNSGAASRRPTEQESRTGELENLFKMWKQTGDVRYRNEYQKKRIEYGLGDGFVNTLNNLQWGR